MWGTLWVVAAFTPTGSDYPSPDRGPKLLVFGPGLHPNEDAWPWTGPPDTPGTRPYPGHTPSPLME